MDLVKQLLTTQPNITSLNLEFSEIEEIDSLLQFLAKFPRLQQLDLTGNRIAALPKNLGGLKELQFLDVSNNMFADCVILIPSLQTLPKLVELAITVQDEREEQALIAGLPRLKVLNDMQIGEEDFSPREESRQQDSPEYESSQNRLSQEDLEQVAVLYDEIRSAWRTESPEQDKSLGSEFDTHVKEVMSQLYEGIKSCQSPLVEHALMLQAKYDLYEVCFQKTLELAELKDEAMAGLLNKLKHAHSQIVVSLVEIVAGAVPKMVQKLQTTKSEMDKSQKETSEVLEAAEQLERENTTLKNDLSQLKSQWEKERQEMISEIEDLKEENQRCLDTLIKHSKATANSALAKTHDSSFVAGEMAIPRYTPSSNMGSARATGTANIQGRALSLKQLKDVIDEIYSSKTKFDQKCREGQLPRETMEQHMYTFLNQKYGLKVVPTQNIILEWAAGIIAGVKKFSSEDNDVMVFGKILKNECDEEFRFVQLQVKETIAELLKMFLRGKFPLKTNSDIEGMLQDKYAGMISEEEWTDIVKYMYNQTDAELLVSLLQDLQDRRLVPTPTPGKKQKLTREELLARKEREAALRGRIPYKDFLKVLLDFQLRGHEKFLQNFLWLFKEVDSDSNGIVNEAEFRQLIGSLGLGLEESEVHRMLQIVDPFNNQNVTFSECVALFSAVTHRQETVGSQDDSKVSVLQRLSMQESEEV